MLEHDRRIIRLLELVLGHTFALVQRVRERWLRVLLRLLMSRDGPLAESERGPVEVRV